MKNTATKYRLNNDYTTYTSNCLVKGNLVDKNSNENFSSFGFSMNDRTSPTLRAQFKKSLLVFVVFTLGVSLNGLGQCTHTLRLHDTYGDGWNGGAITLSVGGSNLFTDLTFTSGSDAYHTFTATVGQPIVVTRTINGSYSSEMRVEVTSGCNTIIPLSQPNTPLSGTAACPTIPTFGNNAWNVLAYNGNDFNFTNYRGMYTENQMAFDTRTRWGITSSPSSANNLTGNAYSGCAVDNNNHSYRYMRQGFPSGTYSLSVNQDDVYELYVNGVLVANNTNILLHSNVWTGILNASSTVEFRVREGSGDSYGALLFNQVLVSGLGTNNISCNTNSTIVEHANVTGNYANNRNDYTTIEATGGAVINISGSYYTESNYDYLRIYASTDFTATPLATYHANSWTAFSYTGTAGQSLTVRFTSDVSNQRPGFIADVVYQQPCCTTPTIFTVSGGSTICPGGNAAIILSNSQVGVNYQLKRAGSNVGTPIAGTGSAISFPNQSIAGVYTVDAIGTGTFCSTATTMTGSATISVNTLSVAATSITGPASVVTGSPATYTVSGGSLGTGASWKWYTGSCGGTLVHTGSTYTTTINATTTYYIRAEGTCNTTDCITITTTTEESCDMIYVDATNGNDLYQGLPNAPVKSLTKAITLVSPSRNYIKMTTGTYAESSIINLQDGLVIDGRYTNTAGVWSKSSNTTASTSITLSGTETINANVAHVMGFKSDNKSNWKLIDLNITTGPANGQSTSGRGKSNYAVWINNSNGYEISRCDIKSGNATKGLDGTNGAAGSDGANGNKGLTGSYDNDDSALNGGPGGVGGTNTWGGNGGNGGRGGNVASYDQRSRGCNGTNGQNVGTTIGGSGGTSLGTSCQNNYGTSADKQNGEAPYNNATQGNNGYSYISGVTAPVSHTVGNYFTPSSQASQGGHGAGGGGGAGGGSSSGEWYCLFCFENTGNSGGGGGGGGGGGQGGQGGQGGGGSFGIYQTNSTGAINYNSINTGIAGTGGIGGDGGAGGIGGDGGAGNSSYSNNRATSAAGAEGKSGGAGGRGQDAASGINGQMVINGVISSPSVTIPNSPIVSLLQIPNKICQNSVLNVTTSTASWTLPTNWEFVKYNNTAVTSEFTNASTTADITTTNTSGFYDVTANGVVFNSYLNVRSERELPVITVNPSPICDGETIDLSATSWGTETDYKWEIFDATDAPNKGLTTGLEYSSSDENPTGITLTAESTPKTYIIRYQVYEECCGWSVPVFKVITVNPHPTPTVTVFPTENVCIGTNVTYTTQSGNGISDYDWSIPGTEGIDYSLVSGGTSTDDNIVIAWKNGNNTAIQVNYTESGCPTATGVAQTISLPPKGTTLSGDNNSRTCYVNGNNPVLFYSAETGNGYLGSVNANGDNLGNVTMTSKVGTASFMEDCDSPNNTSYHTAYMGRRWLMTSSAYPNGSAFAYQATVELPYTTTELNDLNVYATSQTPDNPFSSGATGANLILTKITGGTENGNAELNDCSGIRKAIAQTGNGTNSQGVTNTQFATFNIGEFSEFFLHRANEANSPLPVTLTSFSASCKENVMLSWTTASEQNSDRFVVEKSRDGVTWEFVGEQTAAGNSNTTIHYSQTDNSPWSGVSYYRLRQIDYDGKEEIYGPISVSCDKNGSNISVYPNPNTGNFTVEINSSIEIENADLQLVDVTGKLVSSRIIQITKGVTQVSIGEKEYLSTGTYILKIINTGEYFDPVKVVVK